MLPLTPGTRIALTITWRVPPFTFKVWGDAERRGDMRIIMCMFMGLSLMIGVLSVSPTLGKDRDATKQISKTERMQLKQERKIEARQFKEQHKEMRRFGREEDRAFRNS